MLKGYMKVAGIILLVVGIVGFFYSFPTLFQLTAMHDVMHIVTGIVFLAVSGSVVKSRVTAKIAGYFYLLLALVGIFVMNIGNMLILMPGDTVLHFAIAAITLYFGYKSSSAAHSADQSV